MYLLFGMIANKSYLEKFFGEKRERKKSLEDKNCNEKKEKDTKRNKEKYQTTRWLSSKPLNKKTNIERKKERNKERKKERKTTIV